MAVADALQEMSDAQLAAMWKQGDMHAGELLAREYRPRIYGFIVKRVHAPQDAEDLTQQTWCKAIARISTLREPAQFHWWLVAIAKRLIAEHYNHKTRQRIGIFGISTNMTVNDSSHARALLVDAECHIQKLKTCDRTVMMCAQEERSLAETAVATGLSREQIPSKRFYLRKKLLGQLGIKSVSAGLAVLMVPLMLVLGIQIMLMNKGTEGRYPKRTGSDTEDVTNQITWMSSNPYEGWLEQRKTDASDVAKPWYERYDFASKGLVGYWPLHTDADDFCGNIVGAKIFGNPVSGFGRIEAAYQFDGIGDCLRYDLPRVPTDELTIALKTKVVAGTATGTAISLNGPVSITINLSDSHAEASSVSSNMGKTKNVSLTPQEDMRGCKADIATLESDAPSWQHVALVCDWIDGHAYLYSNGVLAAEAQLPITAGNVTSGRLLIGASEDSNGNPTDFFKGSIEQVVLLGSALSGNEVLELMSDIDNDGVLDIYLGQSSVHEIHSGDTGQRER